MESIEQRDSLVDKLITKLHNEYISARTELLQLITNLQFVEFSECTELELDTYVTTIAYKTTLLSWVKDYILDDYGKVFRRPVRREDNEAIFWVSTACINILLQQPNTISFISCKFSDDLLGISELLNINERNLNTHLVSIFEYAIYKEESSEIADTY